jgi:hypothetical protein
MKVAQFCATLGKISEVSFTISGKNRMRKTHPKNTCPKALHTWKIAWESIRITHLILGQKGGGQFERGDTECDKIPHCEVRQRVLYEDC